MSEFVTEPNVFRIDGMECINSNDAHRYERRVFGKEK